MWAKTLIYLGALLPLIWGIAHLFPTKSVIQGYGDIGEDNKRIIAMEWINEGASLIFIGALTATTTVIDPGAKVSIAVYLLSATFLVALAVISLFTGFRIRFLPFRLCPIIFISSALSIITGWLLF